MPLIFFKAIVPTSVPANSNIYLSISGSRGSSTIFRNLRTVTVLCSTLLINC